MTVKARSISRPVWRVVLIAIALVFVAGTVAPLINAAHYRERIREALEASLARKVAFRDVHFTLFSGPGFSLDDVTIAEDRRFGLEPFAYVPTLQARVRFGKLLRGEIEFSSLRFADRPSLNLVQGIEGAWNVVELVQQLAAGRRTLNIVPAITISGGRVNFKSRTRKATLYVADADLSLYPDESGKLYVTFSGSPARTDRSSNGFGHLHGTANWYLKAQTANRNQLEANVTLERTNIDEIATLLQGYDVGVHGTAMAHLHIQGPAAALRVTGDLNIQDVHRWDLLASAGQNWRVRYEGSIDLLAHKLDLETVPWRPSDATPVMFQVRVNDFLARPTWSILAQLNDVPAQDLLPMAGRMGAVLPSDLKLDGRLDGAIAYSSKTGLAGGVVLRNLVASLADASPLRADRVTASISPDSIHFDRTVIQTRFDGTLAAGADYFPSTRRMVTFLYFDDFPGEALKRIVGRWLTAPSELAALESGTLNGQLVQVHEGLTEPVCSGQVDFANATMAVPELNVPLTAARGRLTFDHSTLDLLRFRGDLGDQIVAGDYHYNGAMKPAERMHLNVASADLMQIEAALEPTLQAQGLLARLHVGHRALPEWLRARALDADISIGEFFVNGVSLGQLRSHLVWKGPDLHFTSIKLKSPDISVAAQGAVSVADYSPVYHFTSNLNGLAWHGGTLNAEGTLETSGAGAEVLHNLRASGNFEGEDVTLSPDNAFEQLLGEFEFSFERGWPDLRLSKVQATHEDEEWDGDAASESDGKLVFALERAGRQRRVVTTLQPENPAVISSFR